MPGLNIPLKLDSWSSGTSTSQEKVDLSYNVFLANMGLFNIASAFTDGADTSQWRFGLLGIGPRYSQCSAWNSIYTASIISWSGALSAKVLSNEFSTYIKSIDTGSNLYAGLYYAPYSVLTTDLATKRITAVEGLALALPTTFIQKDLFVATSWGNKFLICGDASETMKSYPCDANGRITSLTPANTTVVPKGTYVWGIGTIPIYDERYKVIWAKGQYVWVLRTQSIKTNSTPSSEVFATGLLYSIDSAGVFTLVNTNSKFISSNSAAWNGTGSGTYVYTVKNALWSYVKNNTIYCVWHASSYGWSDTVWWYARVESLFTVDMSNTTTFSYTNIKTDNTNGAVWNVVGYFTDTGIWQVWYDTTNTKAYFILASLDIWQANASAFSDTTQNYFAASSAYQCRFTSSITALQTSTWAANNIYLNNDRITIWGTDITGTLASLAASNAYWIFEFTGTNEQDQVAALLWIWLNTSAAPYSASPQETLVLKDDGVALQTINVGNYSNQIALSTITYNVNFNAITKVYSSPKTKLNFELYYANPTNKDVKIGFGLTGGTYASPTGTNGTFWGDGTSGATLTGSASKLQLTVS